MLEILISKDLTKQNVQIKYYSMNILNSIVSNNVLLSSPRIKFIFNSKVHKFEISIFVLGIFSFKSCL